MDRRYIHIHTHTHTHTHTYIDRQINIRRQYSGFYSALCMSVIMFSTFQAHNRSKQHTKQDKLNFQLTVEPHTTCFLFPIYAQPVTLHLGHPQSDAVTLYRAHCFLFDL